MPQLYEFKAKLSNWVLLEERLLTLDPIFIGKDRQVDTYFNVPEGRLKLREGLIENALIHYNRENLPYARASEVLLFRHHPEQTLKQILEKVLGIKIIVKKTRKIYMVKNVKFHFDSIDNLGNFIEVEAIDEDGSIGIKKLQEQCKFFISFFGIEEHHFIAESYSDLLYNLDLTQSK